MPLITDRERALIGKESDPRPLPQPIDRIMAVRWCEMLEDANPIYFDEAFARTTWLQAAFAPPSMLNTWSMIPVWPEPPENRAVRLELEGCPTTIATNSLQEYLLPLRYSDTLTVSTHISAISDEKTTRLGVGHFYTTAHTYRNQFGQVAGTHSFTLFTYGPHPEASSPSVRGNPRHAPAPDSPARVGDPRTEIGWAAGDRLAPISLPLTLRRSVQAVAGTRDYYPFHHDERYARENGAEGVFFNTMFLQGFVGRAVCEWFGHDAFLRKIDVAMRGSNYVGRTLTAEGTVIGTRRSSGFQHMDADVTLATEDGPTTAVKVTVQAPAIE